MKLHLVLLLLLVATAIHAGPDGQPPQQGLGQEELRDFCHLSEGADIYPYEWMATLQSTRFKDPETRRGLAFLSDLDRRFGMTRAPRATGYLVPWVGLTAAWSSAPPQEADAREFDRAERSRVFDGKKSVKMVGTNCALCHSNVLEFQSRKFFIPGAPAMVNVRGFFEDLARSTVSTLADQEALTEFLRINQVEDPAREAEELRTFFMRRLGEDTGSSLLGDPAKHAKLAVLSGKATLALAKMFDEKGRLFKGKRAIADTLEKLLRLTYGFSDTDHIGELRRRMEFLAILIVGRNPATSETPSGFGRTDAFGRIGNLVARGDQPIDYTAPVSFPWLWGMRNSAEMHYNANTNSILGRNIGQSLGLGSIMLDQEGNSTSNLHNIHRLEQLSYAVEVPQWRKAFAEVPELAVNEALAEQGKPLFEKNCAVCHSSAGRVGPQGNLLTYKLFPLEAIGTDPTYARNIVVPVGGRPLGEVILETTTKVRDAYYRKHHVSPEEQAAWEDRAYRGPDFFRDTLLGDIPAGRSPAYQSIKPGMGHRARNLSGIWATAPYLHNGSVPSIAALLGLEERPDRFVVKSHEFDPATLGYRSTPVDGQPVADDEWFDTRRVGNSNAGHAFGQKLGEDEKRAIIEYLKVLPPEPEMASQ